MKIRRLIFFFLISLSVSGCLTLYGSKQHVKLNFKDNDVNVTVYNNSSNAYAYGTYNGYSVSSGVDNNSNLNVSGSTMVTLSTLVPQYTVRISKKGYRTKSHIIAVSKINPKKLIDVFGGLAIGTIGVALVVANGPGQTPQAASVFMIGGGFIEAIVAASTKGWRKYNSSYDFDALEKLPEWIPAYPKIMLDSANIKINKNGLSRTYFETIRDYEKSPGLGITTSYKEEVIINNSSLSHNLNDILKELKFQDTTAKVFYDFGLYCRLTCEINSINFIYAGRSSKAEMEVKWYLMDYFSSVPIHTSINKCSTQWTSTSFSEGSSIKSIEEAIQESLYTFLGDQTNQKKLEELKLELEKKDKLNHGIELDTVLSASMSIPNCVKSVVTIMVKGGGHGSGCVVSKDGYIISNYHVVESDTTGCRVLLANGKKLPYSIVSLDPSNDLALIKVHHQFEKVLTINFEEIGIGNDVFAIGTPTDIELGQSVTKGIISGFRMYNGKKYYQTDVSINPGNSGGALINNKGELIGIVNAKIISDAVTGIGFAIPAKKIKDKLITLVK